MGVFWKITRAKHGRMLNFGRGAKNKKNTMALKIRPKWKNEASLQRQFWWSFCWAIIANDILKLIRRMWTFPSCWNFGLTLIISLVMNFFLQPIPSKPQKTQNRVVLPLRRYRMFSVMFLIGGWRLSSIQIKLTRSYAIKLSLTLIHFNWRCDNIDQTETALFA